MFCVVIVLVLLFCSICRKVDEGKVEDDDEDELDKGVFALFVVFWFPSLIRNGGLETQEWLKKSDLARLGPALRARGFSILRSAGISNSQLQKIGLSRPDLNALLAAIQEYEEDVRSGAGDGMTDDDFRRLEEEEKKRTTTRYYILAGVMVFFAVLYQLLSFIANRPYR